MISYSFPVKQSSQAVFICSYCGNKFNWENRLIRIEVLADEVERLDVCPNCKSYNIRRIIE